MTKSRVSRREFLSLLAVSAAAAGCRSPEASVLGGDRIIDIHQHVGYSGRPNETLLTHQQLMGASKTILLPAGRDGRAASTHFGKANGLQAQCLGNAECWRVARLHPGRFFFGANEIPDAPGAVEEIERYLKLGAVVIGEQKFGVECDSPAMQRLYSLAADYDVPILLHWQHGMYNYGFERFHKMLAQYPRTVFINHAQTWWGNLDAGLKDQANLYPKGKITPGGLTDQYLADYPNCYGDLSAGSGLNALTRDEDFTRDFLARHQDKLLYGSDCNDRSGSGSLCQGWQTIAVLRRLAPDRLAERKLLYLNARRLFRV